GGGAGTSVTLNYTETGAATAIAPSATVSDANSANFNGGSLTVAFTANGAAEDQLTIQQAGGITLNGSNVLFNGNTIGTFTGGSNGTNLVVTFNSALATPTAAQALVEHILYAGNSADPSPAARTVTFTLVDGGGTVGGGADTGTATATINVTAVNDAPDLKPNAPAAVSYAENAAPTALLATGAVSDADNPTDFSGGS